MGFPPPGESLGVLKVRVGGVVMHREGAQGSPQIATLGPP